MTKSAVRDQDLTNFIRGARAHTSRHRKLSFLERRYWDIAERAPFGVRLIEDAQNGPYLLRVYLTPDNVVELNRRGMYR